MDHNFVSLAPKTCTCPCFCGVRQNKPVVKQREFVPHVYACSNSRNDDWHYTSSDSDVHVPSSPYTLEHLKRRKRLDEARRLIKFAKELQNYALCAAITSFIALVFGMFVNAVESMSLTSLHSLFMALAVSCFLCQIVLRISQGFAFHSMPKEERLRRIRSLRSRGMTFYSIGLSIIWIEKWFTGEDHFISWHGTLGSVLLLILFLSDNRFVPKGTLKRFIAANKFQVSVFVILLGFRSEWARQCLNPNFSIFMSVLLTFSMVAVALMMWSLLLFG